MAATEQKFNVKVATQGLESLTALKAKLANLGKEVNSTKSGFQGAAAEIKKAQANSDQSVNSLRKFATSWRELANSVNVTSKEFREYTREAERAERAAAKFSTTLGKAGRLGAAAKITGTVAASTVFGGIEGGAGALIGGIRGGVEGAAVGGATGAIVGQIRQSISDTAEYASSLQKQRIALAGLTSGQTEYSQQLAVVEKLSRQFAIPQEVITRQYTKLAASVTGAGGSFKDAEKAFVGVAAGVRGTGGSLQDLESSLIATAQVFSKGKVSAEELRQQIGERLPGAFTLFAKSLGLTPQELDKALEDGKVSLQDFQKFSELLFKQYGKSSEAIVNSPAAAGERLAVELSKLRENVGNALVPIGALFQNIFAEGIKKINETITGLFNLTKQFYSAIGGAKGLAQIIAGLTKTFIVFGAVTAGVFLATNIATFVNGLRNAYIALRGLLTIEKLLLGVATARAAVEATIAGLKTGGVPITKLIGGAAGLGAGAAIVFGVSKIIDDISTKISTGLAGLAKTPELPTNVNGGNGGISDLPGIDEKQKKQKEIVDLTELELRLIKAINKETADGRTVQAIFFQRNLDYEQAQLAFNRKQIGARDLQAKQDEAELKARQGIAAIFKGYGNDILQSIDNQQAFNKVLNDLKNKSKNVSEEEQKRLDIADQFKKIVEQFPEILGASAVNAEKLKKQLLEALEKAADFKLTIDEKIKKSLKEAYKAATDLGTNLGNVAVSGIDGLADAFTQLAITGKASFADLTQSILADLTKILLKAAIFESINFLFPGLGLSASANGNVFAQNGIQKFAYGGVVTRPTIFPFANGTGLMGEAGPEAIMPLKRDASGRLGVIASNGGNSNVVVNVDASGNSKVQGNESQSKQLGLAISAAVQAELVKQKRPGGLLA
jgi:lambda family phage tail tape measure protein